MSEHRYEWQCGHCQEVELGTGDYLTPPADVCPNCKVGYCQNCFSRIKPSHFICSGCGIIPPVIKSRWVRCDKFAAVYDTQGWLEDGRGPDTSKYGFNVSTMLVDHDGKKVGEHWVTESIPHPDGQGMTCRDIRPLTEEEVALMHEYNERICAIIAAREESLSLRPHREGLEETGLKVENLSPSVG